MTSEEIKQTYSMRDILNKCGLPQPNRSGFIQCPFHKGDREASMKIYDKDFNCFGCGANGDIFTFIEMFYGISFKEAFRMLGGGYDPSFKSSNDVLHGSVSDAEKIRWFTQKGKLIWEKEEKIHGFDGVPATEYVENKERTCIFEPAISMIDAYNKAISEKANDVDYFADAYMKVLGSKLEDEDLEHIRDNRIINLEGDADAVIVDFLQKPNGDTTQENLIDRLEKLIFQISMVANISDENFGTSSGIAMKYKLQGMSNLAKTKERKFTSGMNRRYKLIFSNPVSGMKEDDWVKLHYHFTPNIPSNVLEESQIAGNLDGIVSQETQLGVLSVVDNVQNEMKKIENEQEKAKTDPVMMQMFGGAGDGKSGVLEEPGNGSKET